MAWSGTSSRFSPSSRPSSPSKVEDGRAAAEWRRALAIAKIGVIGAGQMGNGIAHICALAGLDVRIGDVSKDALDKALHTVDRNMSRQAARGTITESQKRAALARIKTGVGFDQ